MAIDTIIERTGKRPHTAASLAEDLRRLGVKEGMTLLVHSSLSSLGWVCGGTQAVIAAIRDALGSQGTLMMPTHSGDLSEPSAWNNPPVPEEWWDVIRSTMPAYKAEETRTFFMGALPEAFRTYPGVMRSSHPQVSFAAIGPQAQKLTGSHSLAYGLGEGSPLARLYELDGHVLLLGVGHGSNTSIHLAEYRAEYASKKEVTNGAPVLDGEGVRQWVEFPDVGIDSDDFERAGADFEVRNSPVIRGKVGSAEAALMPQRPLVDYAVVWMSLHR
ncbi:aminoglycoside N(3)-acetyltransferase [Paenibacillus chitinolyticus]|uniref:aminoglycoside N(3)-acetyltransferase n=1 Tax=Paenibacillus chitinolyticus TaxID=79263 RepID=UPI00366D5204